MGIMKSSVQEILEPAPRHTAQRGGRLAWFQEKAVLNRSFTLLKVSENQFLQGEMGKVSLCFISPLGRSCPLTCLPHPPLSLPPRKEHGSPLRGTGRSPSLVFPEGSEPFEVRNLRLAQLSRLPISCYKPDLA